MRASTPELIGTIASTIETYVLPEFEASDWNASRLRGCLQLLRHLEKRIALEDDILSNINADAENLLSNIADFLSEQLPGDTLVDEINAVFSQQLDDADRNEQYMQLLDRSIVSLHDAQLNKVEAYAALRSKIHGFLRDSTAKEHQMYDIGDEYSSL